VTAPALSLLVPFYRDDPVPLIGDIAGAATRAGAPIELVLHDDGSADASLARRVEAALANCAFPARLTAAPRNAGRAAARNALLQAAAAERLLFLDADMRLPDADFLSRWTAEIAARDPKIAFGGFVAPDAAPDPAHRLHCAFSRSAECAPAETRRRDPVRHLFTSNLLVRRGVLAAEPFDVGFEGWGWEDMEWAARAGSRFSICHIDNPAIHAGLEDAARLLARYRDSAANFARFAALHPDLAARMPLHAWARRLNRAPGSRALRPALSALARGPAPMPLRVAALKLWRASWYGEALP